MDVNFLKEVIRNFKEAFNQFLNYIDSGKADMDKLDFLFKDTFPIGRIEREFTAAVVEMRNKPEQLGQFILQFYVNGFAYNLLLFRMLRDGLIMNFSMGVRELTEDKDLLYKVQEGYVYILERLEREIREMVLETAGVDFIPLSRIALNKFNVYGQYIPELSLDALYQKKEIEKEKRTVVINGSHITGSHIEELVLELSNYFPKQGEQLESLLKGDNGGEKLLFHGTVRQLVEVFRRLMYNGYITAPATDVRDWLCENFAYMEERDGEVQTKPLKENTVYDYLTKSAGDIKGKSKRICQFEWLPYRPHQAMQKIKKEERM